jgi:hypothetical protein
MTKPTNEIHWEPARRRANGSIDIEFYCRRARALRAEAIKGALSVTCNAMQEWGATSLHLLQAVSDAVQQTPTEDAHDCRRIRGR